MWVISRNGFVSLVEHRDDPSVLRARARRAEHLIQTFDLDASQVQDLGKNAPDYRYHADVDRDVVAEAMAQAVRDIDYDSHVKESVAGKDDTFYGAMLGCWHALYRLQDEDADKWEWADDDDADDKFGEWQEPLTDEEWEAFQKATQ